MLAEREAVIEELATHELDLKRALQEKAHHESELRQQKHMLMTVSWWRIESVVMNFVVSVGKQSVAKEIGDQWI